jgi:hypothetical protein
MLIRPWAAVTLVFLWNGPLLWVLLREGEAAFLWFCGWWSLALAFIPWLCWCEGRLRKMVFKPDADDRLVRSAILVAVVGMIALGGTFLLLSLLVAW